MQIDSTSCTQWIQGPRVDKEENRNHVSRVSGGLSLSPELCPHLLECTSVCPLILLNHEGSRNESVLILPSVMARPVEDKNEAPSSSQEPSESFRGQACRGARSWRKLRPANSSSKGPAPSPPGRVQGLGSRSISQRGGERQSSGARPGKALKDMLRKPGFV